MVAFRIVDKRYPKTPAPAPPAPAPVRPVYCYERVAGPDARAPRCYSEVGHEGMHAWEYCQANYDCDGLSAHGCELPAGHEGQHHATVDWDEP